MAKRRARWAILLVLLVMLSFLGIRQVLRKVPEWMRKAEETIAEAGRGLGLNVSFRNLRFHPLTLRVTLDNVVVDDVTAGRTLARAEGVDLSLSLRRLISGGVPVSRIRARTFSIRVGEENRPLLERFRSGRGDGDTERPIPEILLLDGMVDAGPVGPLRRWTAHVPYFRIRDTRFRGMLVRGSFDRSTSVVVLPGGGAGAVPIESGTIDLSLREKTLRIRSVRASGPALSFRGSGHVDSRDRTADLRISGHGDIAEWIRSGGVGGDRVAGFASQGGVDFAVTWKGDIERPDVTGTLALEDGRLPGKIPIEGELTASLSERLLRVDSLRGTLWGGTLEGKGELHRRNGEGTGTLSLTGAALGSAPWGEWGVAWRPAGRGSIRAELSGNRNRIRGSVFLENLDGLERPGERTARIPLPLQGTLALLFDPGREIAAEHVVFRAGTAEVSATGSYRIPDRGLRASGRIEVPGGRAALYGWNYPVSWGSLTGEWEVTGTIDRMHVKGKSTATDLSARSLPPFSATVKYEGDPGKAIHFAADSQVDAGNVTATGTLSGPLSPDPFLLNASVIVREFDTSLAGRWAAAVFRSLGRDPASLEQRVAGIRGMGSANLQISIGGGDVAVSGTLASDRIQAFGADVRTVSVSGGWSRDGEETSWKVRASGEAGDGTFLATGGGSGRTGELFGSLGKIDLAWGLSFLDPKLAERIGGRADLDVAAAFGERGWSVDRFALSVPRLSVRHRPPATEGPGDRATVWLDNVLAEGSLGESSGTLRLTSGSPRVKILADISRQPDWPVSVSVAADNVSTGFLLGIAGRTGISASGSWTVEGDGAVRAASMVAKQGPWYDAVTRLSFAVAADSPVVSEVSFATLRVSGSKDGDTLRGEIVTRSPDSRLSCSLSLLSPFDFRVDGPFSFLRAAGAGAGVEAGNGNGTGGGAFAMEGRVHAAGSLLRPEATTGSLALRNLSYRGRGIELSGEEVSLRFDPAGIHWEGGTLRAEGNPVRVSGTASWEGDLDFRLGGTIPAATARLATDIFDRLDGAVQVNLRVTGRWDDPTLVGTGRLEGGTLSFRGYAQTFEEMNADLVLSRERIVIEDFEGRSGGGYVDGSGEIPLRFDGGERLYFSVDFFDMRYPYPEDFRPVVQGHVELFGPPRDLLISGDVEVQSALYTKTIRLEKAILDFRRRVADVTARRKESDFRIRLDIDAVADGTIRIRNNLGDMQAKGEFKIVGDTRRVIVLGSFDGLEGTVEYRGNRYEVTRLNIDFQDPLRINPRIDARAETTRGNVNVVISVTGTLEKVEVEFASDPPLSKNDIVSLLSLGVTAENLAGAEGSLSAAEAASIALDPYKGRVEEEIRGIVGLDKFTIEPSFSSTDKTFEPRFTVGKSFGERFSVSVSTSVGASAESSAGAEFRLLENVFLQGVWESATADREGDIGGDVRIRYRFRQFRDIFHDLD